MGTVREAWLLEVDDEKRVTLGDLAKNKKYLAEVVPDGILLRPVSDRPLVGVISQSEPKYFICAGCGGQYPLDQLYDEDSVPCCSFGCASEAAELSRGD